MKTIIKKSMLPLFAGSIALGMMLSSLTACSSSEANKSEMAKIDSTENSKIKTVELITLTPVLFNNYIDIQGIVDAEENVSINAEMPGTVSKVNVQLGQEVSAGQVLAELDSKIIQQGVAELQLGLDLATTMFEKQKTLWEQNVGTEVQYLAAKN
ncbi:MAG TPA: biotin/lipoyl-binding protein, partial [Bacteroidia bacterium]|nr:biotin/lipoyl-binding protein [Bacteroidia bacterium]